MQGAAATPEPSHGAITRRIPRSPGAVLGFDIGKIILRGSLSEVSKAVCEQLGVDPDIVTVANVRMAYAATEAPVAPGAITTKLTPGLRFPHHYVLALEDAARELYAADNTSDDSEDDEMGVLPAATDGDISTGGAALVSRGSLREPLLADSAPRLNRPEPSCGSRALGCASATWNRVSGILALGYGLIFGLMAFAIVQGIDVKDPAIFGLIMFGMAVLAGFSFVANFLQAYSARNVLGDVYGIIHEPIATRIDNLEVRVPFGLCRFRIPPAVSQISAGLLLGAGLYLVANPAAALIGETVRRGLLGLTGVADTGANSVDGYGAELFEQFVRALFVTKSLLTLPTVLKRRLQIMADETLSMTRRTIADWSLPLAVGFGIAYVWLTADKDKIGLDDSPMRVIYPPGAWVDDGLMGLGSAANGVVAMKLVLGGMMSLCEEEFSGRYRTSIAFAVLACAAGVATGIATGLATALTTEQIGVLLYNAIYATVANLSFFMDATKATEIARLNNMKKALEKVIPVFRAGEGEQALQIVDALERVKAVVEEKITVATATGGFRELGVEIAAPFRNLLCPPTAEVQSSTEDVGYGSAQRMPASGASMPGGRASAPAEAKVGMDVLALD